MTVVQNEKYHDPDVLENLYWGEEMTQEEVASELGCSKPTVIRWMKEFDIETRDTGGYSSDVPYKKEYVLRNMYEVEKADTKEIALRLDTDPSTVRYWMDKYDIDRQPMGPRRKPPGMFVDSVGYEVFEPDGKRVSHHRLLAVAEFGIEEVKNNNVHHKNGIKWDNRPENLEVLSHADHARLHAMETKFWEHRANA